jgi:hypothetical protein
MARVASAPTPLAGTLAVTLVFSVPADPSPSSTLVWHYLAPRSVSIGFAGMPLASWLVLWSFLLGGLIDRYARNRATRGRGFFGACGAHFPAMLRLSLAELAICAGLVWLFAGGFAQDPYVRGAAAVLALVVKAIVDYARVRLVVEDRRSAAGALLAGARFLRRNAAAAVTVYALFAALLAIPSLMLTRLELPGAGARWQTVVPVEMLNALQLFVVLASLAAATALFQARLAHASYTAGPPLVWPESPAAEAIANLSPPAQ